MLLEIGRIHVRLRRCQHCRKTWPHQKAQPNPPGRSAVTAEKGQPLPRLTAVVGGAYWEGLGQPCVTPGCPSPPMPTGRPMPTCYKLEKYGRCECPGGDFCPSPCPNPSEGPDKRCKACRPGAENKCGRQEFPDGFQLAMLRETVRYEPEEPPLWFSSDWYFWPCRLVPEAQRHKDGYGSRLVYQSARMEEAVQWAWHQIVYEEAHGPLPEWADRVRHLCGVAACYEQDPLSRRHTMQ